MNTQQTTYERDFYAWVNHQALLLKQKKFEEVDLLNLIEEVEALGRAERRGLQSAMRQLIAHLLKMQFQPEMNGMDWNNPNKIRRSSWEITIDNQRDEIEVYLEETPSLKVVLRDEEWVATTWKLGVALASNETNLPKSVFPKSPIWTIEQILDENFYPEPEQKSDDE